MTKVLNGAAMAASKVEHKGQALLWQDARGGGHWDETTGISNGRCPFEKRLKIKPLLSIGPYLCFLFSVQEELIKV